MWDDSSSSARRTGGRASELIRALTLLLLAAPGCSRPAPLRILVPNERPTIHLTTAPLEGDSVFYNVHLTWFAYDPDGRVASFEYAIDPTAAGDTAWQRTSEGSMTVRFQAVNPGSGLSAASSSYHVFVIRAIDNEGARSAPEFDAFTAFTVAPKTQILSPSPSRLGPAMTASTITIRWRGTDPDGADRSTPVRFKYRLASRSQIQARLSLGSLAPTASDLQEFFGSDAPAFTTWDSVPPESAFARYESLPVSQIQFFAVVAIDEAGAYEPRFDLDRNLLQFRPSSEALGPRLTVSNDFVLYTQQKSTSDVSDARIVHVPVTAGEPVRFNWVASPAAGTSITSYRWVLDPLNNDLTDQTPREREDQTYRWSSWSLNESSVLLGPFAATPDQDDIHRLYVEARDDASIWTRVGIEIRAVAKARGVLIVDDFFASPDRDYGPADPRSFQPWGNFPTEAVLDTLMFAVGSVPYRHRPPGTLSPPGMFAGFDYDTLDYLFVNPKTGVPLDLMLRYRAIVWFTSFRDASRSPIPHQPPQPYCALRYACRPVNFNPLVPFLQHGGRLWLFGDGIASAIGLGETENLVNTPGPGSYLYDYLDVRSRIDRSGTDPWGEDLSDRAVPYLPESATPGRPWPPDSTRKFARGDCDETRVGPTAVRERERWASLPCLHLTKEFADWPAGFPSTFKCNYVSLPLAIPADPSTIVNGVFEPAVDTLYLYRAHFYNPSPGYKSADGKPVMFSYWGADHGHVVWTDLPLWMFDRTELQQLAREVMRNFGISPESDPRRWTGPGSANAILDAETPKAIEGKPR